MVAFWMQTNVCYLASGRARNVISWDALPGDRDTKEAAMSEKVLVTNNRATFTT